MVWRAIDMTEYQFNVDGYQYRTWIDDDDDVRKIFHECYFDEKEVKMPSEFYNFTPYHYMNPSEFKTFLDMRKDDKYGCS